jgi:hypothetical protein
MNTKSDGNAAKSNGNTAPNRNTGANKKP